MIVKHLEKIFICLLLGSLTLGLAGNVFSQPPMVDSLVQELKTTESDSQKVLLHVLIGKMRYGPGDSVKRDLALAELNAGLALAQQIDNLSLQAQCKMAYCALYFQEADLEKTEQFAGEAVDLLRMSNDSAMLARALRNNSSLWMTLGDYEKGLESALEAVLIYQTLEDEEGTVGAYINIGAAYSFMGNDSLGLEYQLKCVEYFAQSEDLDRYGTACNNISPTYASLGDYSNALKYQRTAYRIDQQIDPEGKDLFDDMSNLGILHYELGQMDSAQHFLELAYVGALEYQDEILLCAIRPFLAQVLISQHSAGSPEVRRAKRLLEVSIDQCGPIRKDRQLDAFLMMTSYQARMGQVDSVYKVGRKYKKELLKNFSDEHSEKVAVLRVEYDLARNELALARSNEALAVEKLAREEARSQFLVAVAVGILILLLAALLVAILVFQNRQRTIEQENQSLLFSRKRAELENQALRARMNPHFLFNCLNSIQSLYMDGETDKAHDYLVDFGRLMRRVLDYSDQEEISLAEELELAKLYIGLEKVRLEDEIDFAIDLDESVDQFGIALPPLLLQPLLENAIWHGITPQEAKGSIAITVRQFESQLSILVEDEGVGIHKDWQLKNGDNPHGLSLVRDRVQLVDGSITIQNKSGTGDARGTRIQIEIPLK